MADNPTAEATPKAQRFGGLAACSVARRKGVFMSPKPLRPERQYSWSKIHHEQRGNSEECSQRELILAGDCPAQGVYAAEAAAAGPLGQFTLPPHRVERDDDGDSHQRSQHRPQQ